MKKIEGVYETQIVQDARDHLTVKLVPDQEPVPEVEPTIISRLAELFGPEMRIDCEWVEQIPRSSSGKYRYQLNLVGPPDNTPAATSGN